MKDLRGLKQGQQKARSGGGGTGCGTMATRQRRLPRWYQPSEREQVVLSNRLSLYQKPPDSGERQYKLRA